MIKKTFIAVVIALVLGMGVFAVVSTTQAQDISTEEASVESAETAPAAPVAEPVEMENEYEYAYQYGEQNGATDPIMTQTRTRTQLRELQEDGECTGECDPQQLQIRQNLNTGQQAEMRQDRMNLMDGTNNGDCVPQGRGAGRTE